MWSHGCGDRQLGWCWHGGPMQARACWPMARSHLPKPVEGRRAAKHDQEADPRREQDMQVTAPGVLTIGDDHHGEERNGQCQQHRQHDRKQHRVVALKGHDVQEDSGEAGDRKRQEADNAAGEGLLPCNLTLARRHAGAYGVRLRALPRRAVLGAAMLEQTKDLATWEARVGSKRVYKTLNVEANNTLHA